MKARLVMSGIFVVAVCGNAVADEMADARAARSSEQMTSASGAPAQQGVAPVVEHLLPDWGGWHANLADKGIFWIFDAITEFAGNVSGGTREGSTFASQVGVELDIDWQRLAGLTGVSTHAIAVNRSGSSASHLFGDNLLPVQEIYGSGGNAGVHLVSFYGEESVLGGRLDIAAGRMNVENDFASSPLYCNFMNNALCGDPKALPGGDIGHSAYPDATWALRVRVRPLRQITVTTGVYEVSQGLYGDPAYRSGFKFDDSQDSGVYLPVELRYEPVLGAARLPGHYKLGFGYDTSGTYSDFQSVLTQNATGGAVPRHTGNTQFWMLADQMLLRQGPNEADGVIALAGYIHNDPGNTVYGDQYFAGLLDRGFWPARPQDTAGLLFTYAHVSSVLGHVQSVETALDLPLSNGATGQQTHEMVLEANYDVHVARGLSFMPDVQYVIRPNAQKNIPDAVVLGFKAHVTF